MDNITPQWITEQMQDFQIKNPRQLSIASGVRYESLTLALNGKRELSSEIKKTLYWYFRYLDAERQIRDFNSGELQAPRSPTVQVGLSAGGS